MLYVYVVHHQHPQIYSEIQILFYIPHSIQIQTYSNIP